MNLFKKEPNIDRTHWTKSGTSFPFPPVHGNKSCGSQRAAFRTESEGI